jgi:radical SAM superfamily enzyme YgiQ (UPF0313 family)
MRVALLYPSWTGEYGLFGHFAKRNSTWPPLNLALLGAIAEGAGHEVAILDGEANGWPEPKLIQRALGLKPDIIGLTCYSPFFHLNTSLAQGLKAADPTIPIMVGGPHITIMKEKALLPQFDYAFVGEAEKSLAQFLDAYKNGGDLSRIKGVIFRKDGSVVSTEPEWISPPPKGDTNGNGDYPLDQFPFPARHLLDMRKYRLGSMHGRKHFTSIQTMRGCPWKCIFCASEALKTTRVIRRSPKSVVAEMKKVVTDYPYISHFYIVDDVLTLWNEHIVEICDLLDRENLGITFEGSTRANLVDDELIARLAGSGLIRLSFGLETVDTEMRKTMKKKVPLEYYVKANKICEKYGVEALNSVMIGLPGETRETVRKTLAWLRNAREVKQANFAIAVPYPGTEFHERAQTGTHGVELLSQDFSRYLRYGSAVTKVGELTSKDLIELQNEGFVSIYSAPWRWRPMLKKHGLLGGLLMLLRVARLWRRKLFRAANPFRVHPGLP